MSAKRSRPTKPAHSPLPPLAPPVARTGRHVLRSLTVGALPILNEFLRRMRLEEFLRAALPPEDRRMKLSPVKALRSCCVICSFLASRSTAWVNGLHAMLPMRWA